MNDRRMRFVKEYLKDPNAAQAARNAGYSKNTAKQKGQSLINEPDVAVAIAEAMKERNQRLDIDADWVLKQLRQVYERVVQEVKPACNSKTGKALKDDAGNALYTFNAPAALKALELIGKHVDVGAFEDRLAVRDETSLEERIERGRERLAKPRVIDTDYQEVSDRSKALPVTGEGNPNFRPARYSPEKSEW